MSPGESPTLRMVFPDVVYGAIGEAILGLYDQTPDELAKSDPTALYNFLRQLNHFILDPEPGTKVRVDFEGGKHVTSEDDGFDAARGALLANLEKTMPVILNSPTEIRVTTYGTSGEEPARTVLEFVAAPPDLAG